MSKKNERMFRLLSKESIIFGLVIDWPVIDYYVQAHLQDVNKESNYTLQICFGTRKNEDSECIALEPKTFFGLICWG